MPASKKTLTQKELPAPQPAASSNTTAVVKRGRGRPRKTPLPAATKTEKKVVTFTCSVKKPPKAIPKKIMYDVVNEKIKEREIPRSDFTSFLERLAP